MKTFVPNYYKDFKCIANRCKHSCCVGWEIEIDDNTFKKYSAVKGEFAQRLKTNIDIRLS